MSFSNYDNFDNPDFPYSDFKQTRELNQFVAPVNAVKIANNSSEWFDGDIAEKIDTQDKLNKKFKLIKLRKVHVNDDTYKESWNAVQSLSDICHKKRRIN